MVKLKIAKGIFRLYLLVTGSIAATFPWKTIYFRNRKVMNDKRVVRHEMQHINQIEREGLLKYGLKYFYYLIIRGYRNNPYEVEARKVGGFISDKEYQMLKLSK